MILEIVGLIGGFLIFGWWIITVNLRLLRIERHLDITEENQSATRGGEGPHLP